MPHRACTAFLTLTAVGLAVTLSPAGPTPPALAQAVLYRDPVFTEIRQVRDLVYGTAVDLPSGQTVDLTLDYYEPLGDLADARPVLVFLHGGYFVAGDKADGRPYAEELARRGYVAVSINYRLSQGDVVQVGIPAAVSDARQAVRWVRDHAAEHRLDTTRIVIGGASAGAITALFTTYTDVARETAGTSSATAGVLDLWGGLYDHVGEMAAGEPPLVIVHGTLDTVVPYSEALALRDRAHAVGIRYAFYPLDGLGHGSADAAVHADRAAQFFFQQLWLDGPGQPVEVEIRVDPAIARQTVDGFGASVAFYETSLLALPEPKRTAALDLLFRDLGATLLRLRIPADLEPTNDNADPAVTDLDAFNWASVAPLGEVARQALARGVVDKVWAACWSPPGWMKDNGQATNGGRVKPELYPEFAEFLSAYLRGLRERENLPVTGISPFNEPGFTAIWETTTTTPADYRDVLKVAGPRLRALGVPGFQLLGPDTSNPDAANPYLDAVLADPAARAELNRAIVHQYGDSGTNLDWDGFGRRAAAWPDPPWQTEMSQLAGADDGIASGLTLAGWIWTALVKANASAWHHWSWFWPEEADAAQGLIVLTGGHTITDFRVPKRYYVFKQFSAHIHPGAVRVAATPNEGGGLQVLAARDDNTVVVVAFNRGRQPGTATLHVPGARGPVLWWRTSATEDHVAQAPLSLTDGRFTVALAAGVIDTYELSLDAPPLATVTPGPSDTPGPSPTAATPGRRTPTATQDRPTSPAPLPTGTATTPAAGPPPWPLFLPWAATGRGAWIGSAIPADSSGREWLSFTP